MLSKRAGEIIETILDIEKRLLVAAIAVAPAFIFSGSDSTPVATRCRPLWAPAGINRVVYTGEIYDGTPISIENTDGNPGANQTRFRRTDQTVHGCKRCHNPEYTENLRLPTEREREMFVALTTQSRIPTISGTDGPAPPYRCEER